MTFPAKVLSQHIAILGKTGAGKQLIEEPGRGMVRASGDLF